MKKHLRLLLLSSALALGGLLTAAPASATPATLVRELRGGPFANEYDHGYYDGFDDATANKCNYSPAAYEQWYYSAQDWAMYNMQHATTPEDYDFWQGYYSGLQSGYYTQVYCGGSGGGGGGTGPIGHEPVGG